MPSLRGRFVRLVVKHIVGARFKRAGLSIPAWRKYDDLLVKNQRPPSGTAIEPVRIDGIDAEWVRAPGSRSENTVVYFHGGGFVLGSPATHRELAARVSAASGAAALVPDYRLAPEHPFPAAVEDAISVYRWLLDHGSTPTRVAIGGDSAGGGLTLQTLISLRDEGLPLPAAAFALSPVTDWVRFDGESYSTRAGVDPLITLESSAFTASHYVGDNDPATPLLHPIGMDLSGLPPLRIDVGDDEVLLSDSVRLAERARAAGVDAELKVWPGMWHVFQAAALIVPEARRSIEEIGRFLGRHVE